MQGSNQMEYKGYTALVTVDEEADILYGEVVGLRDAIMFEGRSLDEIRASFHTAVDDYLEFCESRGEDPEKPYSGKFLVRIKPDLHRKVATAAQRAGKSLNGWVEETLSAAVNMPVKTESRPGDTAIRSVSTASRTTEPDAPRLKIYTAATVENLEFEEVG
jgi:predicted HicB family RNase H-like nuclease